MGQNALFSFLASKGLPLGGVPASLSCIPLAAWLEKKSIVWQGALPIAVLVSQKDSTDFEKSALARYLSQQDVPVFFANEAPTELELLRWICDQAVIRLEAGGRASSDLRAEAAALRRDYMQLQQNFGATEDFLYAGFAPQFVCSREWAYASGSVQAGAVRQRLPVGSSGLVAVDIWAMAKGQGQLRFTRFTGEEFAPPVPFFATGEGWVRVKLDRPLSGLSEDVLLEIDTDIPLGLSLPTPLVQFQAAGAAAPLALRVWKGLPGIRMPEMMPSKHRHILPASDMPDPEVKGGVVKRLRGRDAFSLHPGFESRMEVVFRDIDVPMAANIAAYVQNFGPETVRLALEEIGGLPARVIYLQAESHGQCDLEIAAAGKVDLRFTLSAPSPMVSVYIRGLEICPVAG
ncbi:MAG: hypothetical protein L3J37_10600 [Rhodobacteraceae bacterium]|nr:hypothetical protein [Paracoccaceae bacterium]